MKLLLVSVSRLAAVSRKCQLTNTKNHKKIREYLCIPSTISDYFTFIFSIFNFCPYRQTHSFCSCSDLVPTVPYVRSRHTRIRIRINNKRETKTKKKTLSTALFRLKNKINSWPFQGRRHTVCNRRRPHRAPHPCKSIGCQLAPARPEGPTTGSRMKLCRDEATRTM